MILKTAVGIDIGRALKIPNEGQLTKGYFGDLKFDPKSPVSNANKIVIKIKYIYQTYINLNNSEPFHYNLHYFFKFAIILHILRYNTSE